MSEQKRAKTQRRRKRSALTDQRGISHSFAFTPGPDGGTEFKIRGIPTRMWRTVRAKARREQVSVRSVVLKLLQTWIDPAA
jgi:hypothetical protein